MSGGTLRNRPVAVTVLVWDEQLPPFVPGLREAEGQWQWSCAVVNTTNGAIHLLVMAFPETTKLGMCCRKRIVQGSRVTVRFTDSVTLSSRLQAILLFIPLPSIPLSI
jgi:hypothetical protein